MALSLERHLIFYGQYHHDPTNIAIHTVCVPTILFTAILLGTNTRSLWPVPDWLEIPNLPPNLGTIAGFTYATLYVLMEPVAGGIIAPVLIGVTALSNYLTTNYAQQANMWAIGIQVVSWAAQFLGHGKYEGRMPALVDNIIQAFFLAPLFVWLEVLFHFGYREELKERLDKEVEKEIAKFRQGKEANGAAKNGQAE